MSFGWIEKVRRRRIVNKRKDAIIDEMPALRRRAPAAATSDRFSGVYVHSNPPRVFKSPNMKDPVSTGLGFKKSNIRIWIHNMNLKNLEQVVWEGCGSQLLPEHSNNLKVKKFLEAVPHMMGMIKDIHVDVQNDDLESLKSHVNPPVPPVVLSGKDQNGLTALHKAAGLGKHEIAEFIVGELPSTVNAVDNEGRTPLHYSVLPKDNNKMFDFLLQNGASESALDNKQKAAAYYKTRHSEIDSKVLNVIPECPRCGKSQAVDWSLIDPSLLSANGVFKHSQENTSERSIKEEKDQKRPKRSQNMKAEEINNNDIKDETVPLNGNINEENIVQAADESNRTTENENEINPPEQTLKVKENTSKAASLENGNEEDTNINKHPETENNNEEDKNNTEDSNHEIIIQENQKEYTKTDENLNTQGKNKDNEQNENLETHGKNEDKNTENNISIDAKEDEKDDALQEDTNETSTINNTNSEFPNQESKPTQNEDTTTNGSRTRPSSKNFLERSRQNSSAKSEVMTNSPNSAKNETENIEMENGEGIIEGVVNGENEVEPMNNEGLPRKDREPIESLIKTGNMEHLASLVLNGEGEKLVGQKSDSAELQSFLDNVPVYMDKIHTIHLAARNGNLRDLQAALDRRKFAVARDSVSSNGATPLHIAVAFGRTSIVRYLAGRFPETLQVEDDLGRIPLHYAAMLRDNGHYYNLLVHLGSDSKSKDKNGLTPEYYMKHPSEFTHQKLLEEFGVAKEESQEILNDQVADDTFSARKPMDDEDMQGVLERCYNVLEGRRNSDKVSTLSNGRITSNNSTKNLIVRNHINRYTFDAVKNRLTKLDHDLYDIIWPSVKKLPIDATFREALDHDFPLGIVAPDFYVYDVFKEFLDPILKYWNLLDAKKDIGPQPERNFSDINQDNVELNLDSSGKWVITDTSEDNEHMTMPFFATEEGRYLASSLGDPLIKGLTEVANKRPSDPIAYLATYLYQFAQNGKSPGQEKGQVVGGPQMTNDNQAVPENIDVVTVNREKNGEEASESNFNGTSRDEHGQSMLHFAAARSHGRNALFQLLLETEISVAFRDELYRTARDISIQANIGDNTAEIDRYVLHIATTGDTNKLVELLLDGYDHITDIVDEDDTPIVEAVTRANQSETVSFLQSVLAFEEKRERVHHAIRQGTLNEVMTLLADEKDTGSGKLLAIGKNNYGRCSLHIAVLCQQEEIVDYLANSFMETLRIGDNLERTALHYAMGVEKMESISKVLIKSGARRVAKDLKGRQPTYYFLNKTDILRLQEEEEMF